MRNVVITGSTRGIGFGMADAFLQAGCGVTLSGRTPQAVEKAVATLSQKHEPRRIFGQACDVHAYEQVQTLWNTAAAHFGKIDIWINNAGLAHPQQNFWELTPEQYQVVISTNILGTMYGSKVAIQGMLVQGFGALYNMEGFGAGGKRTMNGMALYGSSKAGLHFLNRSLVRETRDTPLIVGAIQPGMVITELVTGQFEGRPDAWARFEPVLKIIGTPVETVAPWIVKKILENKQTGKWITYSTPLRMMGRMLRLPFRRR